MPCMHNAFNDTLCPMLVRFEDEMLNCDRVLGSRPAEIRHCSSVQVPE